MCESLRDFEEVEEVVSSFEFDFAEEFGVTDFEDGGAVVEAVECIFKLPELLEDLTFIA